MGSDKRSKKSKKRGTAPVSTSPTAALTECIGQTSAQAAKQTGSDSLQQLFSTELPGMFSEEDDA